MYAMHCMLETFKQPASEILFLSRIICDYKKYKGYYAYGTGGIKGGGYTYKKLRGIEAELIQAGYGKICDYGKGKWEGWQELNSSLQLPLIQHLNK